MKTKKLIPFEWFDHRRLIMDQSMLQYRDSLCAISINISRLLAMLGIVPVVCPYEDMESDVCQYVIPYDNFSVCIKEETTHTKRCTLIVQSVDYYRSMTFECNVFLVLEALKDEINRLRLDVSLLDTSHTVDYVKVYRLFQTIRKRHTICVSNGLFI